MNAYISGDGDVVGLYSPSSLSSLRIDKLATKTSPYPTFPNISAKKKKVSPCRMHRKGQHVVVRPRDEAFYYPGKGRDTSVEWNWHLYKCNDCRSCGGLL